jgi:hypothetical protein
VLAVSGVLVESVLAVSGVLAVESPVLAVSGVLKLGTDAAPAESRRPTRRDTGALKTVGRRRPATRRKAKRRPADLGVAPVKRRAMMTVD